MILAIVACFLFGWKLQLTAIALATACYLLLRFGFKHPHPVRRPLLLWIILSIGFLAITLTGLPEHGLSP